MNKGPFSELRSPKLMADGRVMVDGLLDGEWVEFVAAPDDVTSHGPSIHAYAIAGDFGEVIPYVAPEASLYERMVALRAERDRLLAASDWTQLPDSPCLGDPEWLAYRQALRDFPAYVQSLSTVDWSNLPWPEMPE